MIFAILGLLLIGMGLGAAMANVSRGGGGGTTPTADEPTPTPTPTWHWTQDPSLVSIQRDLASALRNWRVQQKEAQRISVAAMDEYAAQGMTLEQLLPLMLTHQREL